MPTGMVRRESGVPGTIGGNGEGSLSGSFEAKIEHIRGNQGALTIPSVHRAIEVRMKTMAMIVIEYQQLMGAGKYFRKSMRGNGSHLNYLLQVEPNPLMSAADLWEQVEYHKIAYGNAFIYVERDEVGEVKYLWLCDSGDYIETNDRYILQYHGLGGLRIIEARRSEVIHLANTYRRQGSIMGIPTLEYALRTLTLKATEMGQALETAAKGGRMKLIISEERKGNQGLLSGGMYDKDEVNKYADEVNRKWHTQDVIALQGLEKATPYSMTGAEMQLLESMGYGDVEIARLYGVPKALLMDDSNSSYKTPEAATQELLSRTIAPAAKELVSELQRKLLDERDFERRRFEAKIGDLFMFDRKATAEINKMKMETGVSSVNELRADNNMPQVTGGDVIFVSANLRNINETQKAGNNAGGGEQ